MRLSTNKQIAIDIRCALLDIKSELEQIKEHHPRLSTSCNIAEIEESIRVIHSSTFYITGQSQEKSL